MRRGRSAGPRLLLALVLAWPVGVAAALRVELEGVEGELRDNIRAYLGTPPEDVGAAVLASYQRHVQREARRAAEALGYYAVRIRVERERTGEADWLLRLRVEPGERVRLRQVDVRVEGPAESEPPFRALLRRLALEPGDPLHHGRYEAAKQSLRDMALSRGYFDARYRTSRVVVHPDQQAADVELVLVSGQRYRFGPISFSDTPFRRELLDRITPFEPGEPYHADQVAALTRRLNDSGYFRQTQVRLDREGAQDQQVPVKVGLKAQYPNRLSLGAGFSTDEGPRGRLTWERPWVNSYGHSLQTGLRVSQVRQSLTGRYQIPLDEPLNEELNFSGGLQRERVRDTTSRQLTLGVERADVIRGGWRRAFSLRLQQESFSQGDDSASTRLILPGFSLSRTKSSGGLDVDRGHRWSFNVEAAERRLLSDISLVRFRAGTKWLFPLGGRHRVHTRADAGALTSSDFGQVPASLRFFAGGDQSVRGFGFQSIAPQESDGDLAGGRYLLTGSLEYQYELRERWRVALFTDSGSAFDDPASPDPRVGSGFGLRWVSPVGPVRLDFAWGVSEPDTPFRVHFSMGPAL